MHVHACPGSCWGPVLSSLTLQGSRREQHILWFYSALPDPDPWNGNGFSNSGSHTAGKHFEIPICLYSFIVQCRFHAHHSLHVYIPLCTVCALITHHSLHVLRNAKLKLCRRGEPDIFCHVKSAKDRREVDATLIVHGRMWLRTEKGTKVAGNLLHVSSYRASNIIHTERWSVVGWTTRKRCLSVFVLFCWRHAYVRKIPGSPCDKYLRSRRAWERGYTSHCVLCVH